MDSFSGEESKIPVSLVKASYHPLSQYFQRSFVSMLFHKSTKKSVASSS